MLHRFKILSLVFTLAAVGIFVTSCGSSNASLRIVQAIPDVSGGQPLDIYIDGNKVASSVGFGGLYPTSGYKSTASGSRHLQVYVAGQLTGALFDGNVSLASGTDYTVVLTGSVTSNTVVAPLFTDNNTPPTSTGNFELRVIHASPTWNAFYPSGMTFYLLAPNTALTCVSPSVPSLTYKNASSYVSAPAGSYDVVGTPMGLCVGDINQQYSFNAGQIRTLVIVDAPGGGLSALPLELNDLN